MVPIPNNWEYFAVWGTNIQYRLTEITVDTLELLQISLFFFKDVILEPYRSGKGASYQRSNWPSLEK